MERDANEVGVLDNYALLLMQNTLISGFGVAFLLTIKARLLIMLRMKIGICGTNFCYMDEI